ncbi:hypothetical protein TWF696_002379 [Orbilia brochopaga]|uniref:AB hydrolase-1 domain-containing protein n=1 Tax=Orbilia brochopaga TaxID=3140254 RepID=A0AAV9U8D5_9PEZI
MAGVVLRCHGVLSTGRGFSRLPFLQTRWSPLANAVWRSGYSRLCSGVVTSRLSFEKSNVSRLRCASLHSRSFKTSNMADGSIKMRELLLKQGPYVTAKGVLKVEKHIIPAFPIREHPRGVWDENDKLNLVVNHYRPVSNPQPKPGDLTLIVSHANGFHKEMYEPFLEHLVVKYEEQGAKIRGIFIADMFCQGESGILNEKKLGGEVSWFDHTRDLLSLIQHFPNDIVRPIAGIGHSMGGAQLFRLSLMHPTLLSCVIGVDPVIMPPQSSPASANFAPMSARRRDIWPSREAAVKFFKSRPYYSDWDQEVLGIHMDMGLRKVPTALYPDISAVEGGANAVTLTTTKHQEVFTFYRTAEKNRRDPGDMFSWLKDMRIPVCYIQGKTSVLNWADNNEKKMENTPQPCEMHIVDCGHLVPLEKPRESAEIAADYLFQQVKAWKEKDEAFKKLYPPTKTISSDFFDPKPRTTKL